MHLIVQRLVYRFFYFFIIGSATNATCAQGTMTAIFGRTAVLLFVIAFFILVGFFVRKMNAFGRAGITVVYFIKLKTLSKGFIMSEVGNIGSDAPIDTSLKCFAAAIAGISCYFFYL